MAAAQGRTIKLMVGGKEFDVDGLQLAVLASSLEEAMGMELELPEELAEAGDIGVAAS